MRIEYFHSSKFGNGVAVAEEFRRRMTEAGSEVGVHDIGDVDPRDLPAADLYVFSSPGRMGRPIGRMRRFLGKLALPAGTRYALLTTEGAPQPDKKTGKIPDEAELAKTQRVRPVMNEILEGKGLTRVDEDRVLVTGIKGPLEPGWEDRVGAFASRIGEAF